MSNKPTYEELEQRVKELEQHVIKCKQAEEMLQESEQHYRIITEASLHGMYKVDAKGDLTFANQATAVLTGYSLAELNGLPLDTIFPPGEAGAMKDTNIAILSSGKPVVGENMLTRKDGHRIETYFSCVPLFDKSGEYTGLVGSILNITDRKQAEEKIYKSEEQYRSLIENNPYGVQEIDKDGIIVFANSAHCEIYGYEKDDLLGRSVVDFILPGSQCDELPGYLESLVKDQPEPTPYYGKILKKGGEERDIEVSWNYLRDEEGGIRGFVSVSTDIT